LWAGGRQQPQHAAPRHDDPCDHLRGLEVTGQGPGTVNAPATSGHNPIRSVSTAAVNNPPCDTRFGSSKLCDTTLQSALHRRDGRVMLEAGGVTDLLQRRGMQVVHREQSQELIPPVHR